MYDLVGDRTHSFMIRRWKLCHLDRSSFSNIFNNCEGHVTCELGGLVVSALDFHAGYRGFESRWGRDNFQTISTPRSYSTCLD